MHILKLTKKHLKRHNLLNIKLDLRAVKINWVLKLSIVFCVLFFILVSALKLSSNKINANLSKSPNKSDAMFVNVNPDFTIEFGDKNNPSKPTVKFNAVPSDLNPITGDSVNVITNNSILDNLVNGFKENVLNDLDTKYIEFSLSNAKVDTSNVTLDVSTTLPEIPSSNFNQANSAPDFLNISTTENLSKLISESLNIKLSELEKSNQALGAKVNELKSQVGSIIDSSKDIYASTDLVEEKDKKDYVVNKSILPGVDAKYSIIEGKGVKEEIIINKLDSYDAKCYENIPLDKVSNLEELCSVPKNQYVFDLKLDKDVKVNRSITTTKTNPVPVWYFTDYYGRYLAHIDPPFAYDANNNKTNNVSINISDGKIVLTVDLLWLLDPERAYPITIDPNIIHDTQSEFATGILNGIKDAGVSNTNPQLEIAYQEIPKDIYTNGLWHFNEGSGTTAFDSSGLSNNGGLGAGGSSPTWLSGSNPAIGLSALSFDGDNDYLSIPDNDQLDPGFSDFTIESWVLLSPTATGNASLYSKGGTSGTIAGVWIYYQVSGRQLVFNLGDGVSRVTVNTTVPELTDNKWHHLAFAADRDSNVNIYIDGLLKNSGSISAKNNIDINTTRALILGNSNIASTSQFAGFLDDLEFSKTLRTPLEIYSHAKRKPYGVYTSDTLDLSSIVKSIDSLGWTQSGVQTFDSQPSNGETPADNTSLIAQWNFNPTSGFSAPTDAGSCGSSCNLRLINFSSTASQDSQALSGWTNANKKWGAGSLMLDSNDDYACIDAGNDGTCDDINSFDFGSNHPFTIETWINYTNPTGSKFIFHKGEACGVSFTRHFYYLELEGSQPIFAAAAGNTYESYTTNGSVKPGVWSHIVILVNSLGGSTSDYTFYINGIRQTTVQNWDNNNAAPNNTSLSPLIGACRDYSTNPILGYGGYTIDSLRIYDRAISESEILSNYQAGNIEFQTRSGSDTSPGLLSWESWKPISINESVFDNFDFLTSNNAVYEYANIYSPNQINFVKVSNSAPARSNNAFTLGVLPLGQTNQGDDVDAYQPAVILDNNVFKMWYTGNDGAVSMIYSATSPDGFNWQKVNNSSEPPSNTIGTNGRLPNGVAGSGDDDDIAKSTVIKDGNIYKMWYNGFDGSKWQIFGATSNDGLTWTKIDNTTEPASNTTGTHGRLPLGSSGRGDKTDLYHPYVIKDGTTFRMWYNGYDSNFYYIMSATSNDGLTWTKLDNTTEPASDTLGTNGRIGRGTNGTADADGARNPTVIKDGGLYKMWYAGVPGNNTLYAISFDALTWNKIANTTDPASNTVGYLGKLPIGIVGTGDSSLARVSSILKKDNSYFMYYNGMQGSTSRGFLAIATPFVMPEFLNTDIKYAGTAAILYNIGQTKINGQTVGLWHLDETNTTGNSVIIDSSIFANNGNLPTGSEPTVVHGIISKARSFSTGGKYITIPHSESLSGFTDITLELWAKPNSLANYGSIINKRSSANGAGFTIEPNASVTNSLQFVATNAAGVGVYTTQNTFLPGVWQHISVVGDSASTKIFINGILISTYTSAPIGNNTEPLLIGKNAVNGDIFDGYIDEISIHKYAKSQSEILTDFKLGSGYTITKSLSTLDLTNANKVPFYIAADRPGQYLSFTIGESRYSNSLFDSNTLSYFKFDEIDPLPTGSTSTPVTGWVINSSQYPVDASLGTGSSRPSYFNGIMGNSLKFDGNDYVSTSFSATHPLHVSQSSPVTISAWLYPVANSTSQLVVSKGVFNLSGYGLGLGGGTANVVSLGNHGGGTLNARNALNLNSWNYVVGVINNSNSKIYINGVLDATGGVSTITSTQPIIIGAGQSQNGSFIRFYNGFIDELSISGTERSADEIKQAYDFGRRTHLITIDFAAKLDVALSGTTNGSGVLSTTALSIDATYYGLTYKGSNLYKDDKIILKENYNGIDYFAEGQVNSVTSGGAVTVTGWDVGSLFPPKGTAICGGSDTHCFGVNASVFKWQREYFDISGITKGIGTGDSYNQLNTISYFTVKVTNGTEGRTILLDDFRYANSYITSSPYSAFGTTNQTSTNRYFQYRSIMTSSDISISSSLSLVDINYSLGPLLSQIMRHGKWFSGGTKQPFWWVN